VKLTKKQVQANQLLAGDETHAMLFGGSRSGKTFVLVRALCTRATKAPKSRHAILRFRFNAVKNSVVLDTFPKVMELCFPNIEYHINKSDWYAEFSNGSQIWFGGLDDKERTEKILGMEFVTMYFNECSQLPYGSVETALTRLAQKAEQAPIGNLPARPLKPKAYYDCNPPNKSHWTYKLFKARVNPDTNEALKNPDNYVSMQINPADNTENLTQGYLENLGTLSARARRRFLEGEFADANPNGLFQEEHIDRYRVTDGVLPDMVRIAVGVDPSGSDDEENADNDAIGIVVGGLGTDGNAYLLEDCTVKAGPATWGAVATSAYDRHKADVIVGEHNYGGAMVKFVIQTARPRTNYKIVHATRGKTVRAEPFGALYEHGKVRHAGYYNELEEELAAFSTIGYVGSRSPNRADAWIWVLTELFPAIVKPEKKTSSSSGTQIVTGPTGWMN
jgi:hypothetical protein